MLDPKIEELKLSSRTIWNSRKDFVLPLLLAMSALMVVSSSVFAQQGTLTDDAYTNSGQPNTNFGAKDVLNVSSSQNAYIKLKLTPGLPPNTPGSYVAKATLKLYVGTLNNAGSVDVYRVVQSWSEGSITANVFPARDSIAEATGVAISAKDIFITVDLTSLVQRWLGTDGIGTGGVPNFGIVLVANAVNTKVGLDSKENAQTSHVATLEIVLNHAATADQATNANSATNASTANSATSVTGTVNASQVNGPLTNATIGGSNVTGTVANATTANTVSVPLSLSGSSASSILSVTNTGTGPAISGTGAINTSTQYNIGGSSVLSIAGTNNVMVGAGAGQNNTAPDGAFFGAFAGQANTVGVRNSFFGSNSARVNTNGGDNAFFGFGTGQFNTNGSNNVFFGAFSGQHNTTGQNNSFVGSNAGISNTTGVNNSFFGLAAGRNNATGSNNAFFGYVAGEQTTGGDNAFFGGSAGEANTAGIKNSFFGSSAGLSNTTENNNTFIGAFSNGVPGITNATAIGAGAQVTASNTMVLGTNSVTVQIPGTLSASGTNLTNLNASNITSGTLDNARLGVIPIANGGTGSATQSFVDLSSDQTVNGNKTFSSAINTSTQYNIGGSSVLSIAGTNNVMVGAGAGQNNTAPDGAFFGAFAGQANTVGVRNSFFGSNSARVNTNGGDNAFFGFGTGQFNTNGSNNVFFGAFSGQHNTTGQNNSFVGSNAGISNTTGVNNSFFGLAAGRNNATGSNNAFFGYVAGEQTTGGDNAFFGGSAGEANTAGIKNSFFGSSAGLSNTTENNNTFIGAFSNGVPGITNATAIGAGAQVTASNTMVLGSINGVNSATADTNVGVGTTTPTARFHVQGGNVYVGSPGQGIILKSPDGSTCKLLTIDNAGAMVLTTVTCP